MVDERRWDLDGGRSCLCAVGFVIVCACGHFVFLCLGGWGCTMSQHKMSPNTFNPLFLMNIYPPHPQYLNSPNRKVVTACFFTVVGDF